MKRWREISKPNPAVDLKPLCLQMLFRRFHLNVNWMLKQYYTIPGIYREYIVIFVLFILWCLCLFIKLYFTYLMAYKNIFFVKQWIISFNNCQDKQIVRYSITKDLLRTPTSVRPVTNYIRRIFFIDISFVHFINNLI